MEEILAKLHQASVRMDQLASRAQSERTEEIGAALVAAVSDWVELVEIFVEHCPDRGMLATYLASTQQLESLLSNLENAHTEDELAEVRRALPSVVEQWGQVIAQLIGASMASLTESE